MIRTFIVVAGLMLALPAFAQSTKAVEGKRPPRVAMAEKLGLSAPQAEKMKSIMRASRQQNSALKAELQKTQDRKAKRVIKEKMQAARAGTRQKLSEVLSAEQLRKYDALRSIPPRRSQPRSV